MSSKLLAVFIVAFAVSGFAFQSNSLTNRISQLQQEGKLKHANPVRTAGNKAKPASSTTYVTLQLYESSSCGGSPYIQDTFVTGLCFETASASAVVLSGMYTWDSDSDVLSVELYTDIACTLSSGYVDSLSLPPPNECYGGLEIQTATSMPSLPSADGVKLDGYTSSSSCNADSNLLLEYWLSDSAPSDDDDDDDDASPFADDMTFTCDYLPIPFQFPDSEVNFTIAAFVTKSDTSASSSKSSCFAGSETVQLEDGTVVPISSVVVGDRILAADVHGRTKYSSVISVPHDSTNTEAARFTHLVAASGKDIKMTPDHLVSVSAACDGTTTLMQAGEVQNGMCLVSVDGVEKVVDSKMVRGNGVHTIVTEEEMVVVNGFVASPFAHNHAAANAYYNIIRMLPSAVMNSRLMKQANTLFGSLVTAFSR